MIKEHRRGFKVLRLALDLGMLTGFYFLFLWFTAKVANPLELQVFWTSQYRNLPALLALCWLLAFVMSGGYDQTRRVSLVKAMTQSIKSLLLMMLVFSVCVFAFKIQFISRKFFFVYAGIAVGLLFTSKLLELKLLRVMRSMGFNTMSVLMVGEGPALEETVKEFREHQEWGYRFLGVLTSGKARKKSVAGLRVLGKSSDLEKVIRNRVVDMLVITPPPKGLEGLRDLLDQAEAAGIPVRLAMGEGLAGWNLQTERMGENPLIVFQPNWHNPYKRMIKVLFDFIAGGLLVLLLSPVLLAVSLGILLTMGGPVFFKQKRLGKNNRAFMLYKFRTMVNDAVSMQEELKGKNEMSGPVFKIEKDPRITPLGAFLRKWSLDELPQLFNVLRGELSLVGPRPLYFFEGRAVPPWARRRYSMKPGITCYWQVMGRNQIGFEDWMKLDLKYVDNWSLSLDLYLLLKTIPAVLGRKGAY